MSIFKQLGHKLMAGQRVVVVNARAGACVWISILKLFKPFLCHRREV
jgi:hypothetical protein